MDTVSFAWRPTGHAGDDLIAWLRSCEGTATASGAWLVRKRLPGDARVLVFDSLVAVEGRLGALLTGIEGEHGLWDWRTLTKGAERAGRGVLRLAEDAPGGARAGDPAVLGAPEVRRLDLAGELTFSDGSEGLAFLDALAGLRAPRCKTVAWRKDAAPQTVYWVADRSGQVKMRAYDKGVESGTARPGERVRVELQHRPPKGRRKRPAVLAHEDLRDLFIGGLRGWADSAYDVERGDVESIAAVLYEREQRGELTARKVDSLVGQLVRARLGADELLNPRTKRHRLAELRKAGLVVEPPKVEHIVPVVARLDELRERFAA